MKRYLEKIYEIYKESFNNDFDNLFDGLEIEEKKPEIIKLEKNNNNILKYPSVGNLYLIDIDSQPVYGLIVDDIDDYLVFAKCSEYYEFATQSDFITEMDNQTFIVEIWNKFYLTKNEILNLGYFIDRINNDDLQIIIDYLEEKIDKLPENRSGFTIPEGNYNFIQNKFQKNEAKIVQNYALRILNDNFEETDIIKKENFSKLKAVAADKTIDFIQTEKFDLFYYEDEHKLKFYINDKNLINKKVYVKIVNQYFIFENLKEEFELFIDGSINLFSLESLSENIEIDILDE